jgi:transcriptional regulator GlxA family with amidase domain
MSRPHNILLIAFPDGQLLDIAGPLQMFAGANAELSRPAYRIEIAAPEAGPFPTSSGVRLVADMAFADITNRRLASTDTLMTVGGEPPPGTARGLQRDRGEGSAAPRIASVCKERFLAPPELDGRAATH